MDTENEHYNTTLIRIMIRLYKNHIQILFFILKKKNFTFYFKLFFILWVYVHSAYLFKIRLFPKLKLLR